MKEKRLERLCRKCIDGFDSINGYIDKLKDISEGYNYPRNIEERTDKATSDLHTALNRLKEEGYAASTRRSFKWSFIGMLRGNIKIFIEQVKDDFDRITTDELGDKPPSEDQIKRIIYSAPNRIGAFILALASSGARPRELLRLRVDDIDYDHDPACARVYDNKASKTREITKWIFFTDECINYIREVWDRSAWLTKKQARDWARDGIDILTPNGKKITVDEEDLLFPFTIESVEKHWNNALDSIGLNKELMRGRASEGYRKSHYCKKYRLYTLRTRWMTIVGNNVKEEMRANALIAHLSDLERRYTDFDRRELANIYNEVRDKLVLGV